MTKNLFLYINPNKSIDISKKYKDVYCFENMIVAIDKNIYDRKDRLYLQKKLNVHPYYISQEIFKEILYLGIDIKFLNIDFIDNSIEDTSEYEFLQYTMLYEKSKLYNAALEITKEFDTEIRSIIFLYKSMKIELTNEGILNFYSDDNLLHNLVNDSTINNLLIGRCCSMG